MLHSTCCAIIQVRNCIRSSILALVRIVVHAGLREDIIQVQIASTVAVSDPKVNTIMILQFYDENSRLINDDKKNSKIRCNILFLVKVSYEISDFFRFNCFQDR